MAHEKRFALDGNSVQIIGFDPNCIVEKLPAAIYTVSFHPMMGFSLSKLNEQFEVPPQLFGDLESKVDHLLGRYDKTGDMSAMLTGAKGSGKSLLAHVFSNRAIKELDKPVIIVDNHFDNPNGLMKFLYDLGDCVFIFDEFAKKMDEHQDTFLDFFSGTYKIPRAIFVIENSLHKINEFMLDRPGRVRWSFSYGKLPLQVVKEVCDAREVNEKAKRHICEYAARAITIGMDNLNTIIDEVQLSDDSVNTASGFKALVGMLNIPSNSSMSYKLLSFKYKNEDYPADGIASDQIHIDHRSLCMTLADMENHPLVKAMVKDENTWLLERIENETYEIKKDSKPTGINRIEWYAINFRMDKCVYSDGGNKIFIHKQSGVSFEVALVDEEDDYHFDLLL